MQFTTVESLAKELHAAKWSYGDTAYASAKGIIYVVDAYKDGEERQSTEAVTLKEAYRKLLVQVLSKSQKC